MSKPKFTRASLQEILRSGAGLEVSQARELARRIIESLAAAIAAGEVIELRGFGTFEVRERKARRAHNPRTMAPVDVPARRVVFFKPGQELKVILKGGMSM